MKVTKKRVANATITKKGFGFNPFFKFHCQVNGFVCTKPFSSDRTVYINWTNKDGEFEEGCTVMDNTKKKDFIDAVYRFINENS